MNTLIVYTHPNHESLNYSFLEKVKSGLALNNQDVDLQILDLYADNFDPRLSFDETFRRRDLHKEPAMSNYRDQLLWADQIIYIYPIWWGRPPAMLLGYFDRLLSTNFAYKYKSNNLPEGLIKGKSVVCISTMKGPTFYPMIFLKNAHKTLMKKAVFNFVGIKNIKFFEFGFMETKKNKQEKALNKVHKYFAAQ